MRDAVPDDRALRRLSGARLTGCLATHEPPGEAPRSGTRLRVLERVPDDGGESVGARAYDTELGVERTWYVER